MRLFYAFIGFLWGSIAGAGMGVGLYSICAGILWLFFRGEHIPVAQAQFVVWILVISLVIALILLVTAMILGTRRGYAYGKSLKKRATLRTMMLHLLLPAALSVAISLFPYLITR